MKLRETTGRRLREWENMHDDELNFYKIYVFYAINKKDTQGVLNFDATERTC